MLICSNIPKMPEQRQISILPPEEAKKIAAGEVIDRPSALAREFLDNAIDAGGKNIEVLIEEGGIKKTEVVDDGGGMGKEDLELCWLTHATSKIRSLEDLGSFATLGFRGEALSAAAAVSRLEILSSTDGREAWKLSIGPEDKNAALLEESRRTRGSSVRSFGLYDTIPARKRFLKRPGSEALACKNIFNEKALPFPGIAFKFFQDADLKIFLPPARSLCERFGQIFLEENEAAFLHEISASGSGFSITAVIGGPELFRRDRRLQFIFANSRRIQDFSLLQALEYGLEGWFPNGTHPLGAVFINIDPGLADFNIHPAKREARFTDPGAIHHALSSSLRNFSRKSAFFPRRDGNETQKGAETLNEKIQTAGLWENALQESLQKRVVFPDFMPGAMAAEEAAPYQKNGRARYLGRLFGLFILVEKGEELFIIDQHAAHERVLYENFIRGPIQKQELLVPIPFSTESPDDDKFLEQKLGELDKLGIIIKKADNEWQIDALPAGWNLSDRETVEEILNLKTAGENMAGRWAAGLSCRKAVKDGDYLDEKTAMALAEEAFALPVSLCPHGRPIWQKISREELFKAVKRS